MWIDRETLRAIYETIVAEARAAVAPFTRGGKLDLSTPNKVGHLPAANGGTGTAAGAEPPLGNPAANGHVLSSTTAGVRSWVAQSGGALPWFDVTDPAYGATGDGTTDDTAAINLAIAALNTAGAGVLYFPAGIYATTGGLTAITAPCTIRGDGIIPLDRSAGGSEVRCTSATAVLFTVNAKAAKFADIALRCTHANPTAGAGVLVTSAYIHQRCDFDTVYAGGFYDCLDIAVGGQWSIHACEISSPVRYGVRIRNTVNDDAGDWAITNTNLNGGLRDSAAGLRIESSGGGKIANVKINCGAPGDTFKFAYGIDVANAGAATSILLIGNVSIENYTTDGIRVVGPNWSQVIIHGCQINTGSATAGSRAIVATSTSHLIIDACFLTSTGGTVAIALTSVDNVVLGAIATNGYAGKYSATSVTNLTDLMAAVAPALDDLTDVDAPAPNDGDVLTFDSGAGEWVALAPPSNAGSAWSVLTNGDGSAPELVFDSFGDAIMTEVLR